MSQSNLDELKETLSNHKNLFEQGKFEIVLNNIVGIYLFKKPVFSFTIKTNEDNIKSFMEYLNLYFFAEFDNNASNIIFISRFKTFIEVVQNNRELIGY